MRKTTKDVQDFSQYDAMRTEALAEILQEDLLKPAEEQLPEDELLYISNTYYSRLDESGLFSQTTEEAFAEFKQHYMPQEPGEVARQQAQEEADLQNTLGLLQQLSQKENKHAKTSRPSFRKYLLIAAIIAVVLSLMMLPINASGETVFDTIVIWTKDAFQFLKADDYPKEELVENTEFQEFLRQHGVTEPVATLLPKGYTLLEASVIEKEENYHSYSHLYQRGEDSFISFQMSAQVPGSSAYVERSSGILAHLKINGTEFFIFKNLDNTVAVWLTDSYLCLITGPVSVDDMKTIVYSVAAKTGDAEQYQEKLQQ